jgi:hypothetical protein
VCIYSIIVSIVLIHVTNLRVLRHDFSAASVQRALVHGGVLQREGRGQVVADQPVGRLYVS